MAKGKSHDEKLLTPDMTFSQRLSDKVANTYGSWKFISIQSSLIIFWVIWNQIPGTYHFDPPPFILLNLILSFIAGYTGSFLQMSANRQAQRDREILEHDYESDVRSEKNIRIIKKDINQLEEIVKEIGEKIDMLNKKDV